MFDCENFDTVPIIFSPFERAFLSLRQLTTVFTKQAFLPSSIDYQSNSCLKVLSKGLHFRIDDKNVGFLKWHLILLHKYVKGMLNF